MKKLVLTESGVVFEDDLSADEVARITITAPSSVSQIDFLAFLHRFTPDERIAIRRGARADGGIEDSLEMLRAAMQVNLTDPATVSLMNALVNAGLITAARRDAILTGEE